MIKAYCGLLGSGKSFSMCMEARRVVGKTFQQVTTNMAGLHFPLAIYADNLNDLLSAENSIVLLDEAGVVANSRDWARLPGRVREQLMFSRKNGVDLYYTLPQFERVDSNVRDITSEVVMCRQVRLGPFRWIYQSTYVPISKKPVTGHKFIRLDPKFFPLYDTYQLIRAAGGSVGTGAKSTGLSRKRDATRQAGISRTNVPLVNVWSGVTGEGTALVDWHDASKVCLEWLSVNGHLAGMSHAEQIVRLRQEVYRRQWLALFDLTYEDVPADCTYECPWLDGRTPEVVWNENSERAALEAAEAIVSYAKERHGRR